MLIKETENIGTGSPTHYITSDGVLYGAGKNDNNVMSETGISTIDTTQKLAELINEFGSNTVIDVLSIGDYQFPSTIVLLNDKTVRTIGLNRYGSIGRSDDNETEQSTWYNPSLTNIDEIQSMMFYHESDTNHTDIILDSDVNYSYQGSIYALKSDGKLYGWGSNYHGQLGTPTNVGTYTGINTPTLISENVEKFWAFGSYPSLFVLINDGSVKTLKTCGSNNSGVLGIDVPNFDDVSTLTTVVGIDPNELINLVNGGSGINTNNSGATFALCTDGVYSTGDNRHGTLGIGGILNYEYKFKPISSQIGTVSNPVRVIDGIPQIWINYMTINRGLFTYIQTENGDIHGCGKNGEDIKPLGAVISDTVTTFISLPVYNT